LADVPAAIPTMAKWFYDEWHTFDGRSIDQITAQLSDNLNRHSLPITFVAHENLEIMGTVSLDISDLPEFDCYSPWLSSLYVHEGHRGKGVASTLVSHLKHFACSGGVTPLYLWTPGSTSLYERLGWFEISRRSYRYKDITIMSYAGLHGCSVHSVAQLLR
jgi:GNAT superfamily N-acetyltransferase